MSISFLSFAEVFITLGFRVVVVWTWSINLLTPTRWLATIFCICMEFFTSSFSFLFLSLLRFPLTSSLPLVARCTILTWRTSRWLVFFPHRMLTFKIRIRTWIEQTTWKLQVIRKRCKLSFLSINNFARWYLAQRSNQLWRILIRRWSLSTAARGRRWRRRRIQRVYTHSIVENFNTVAVEVRLVIIGASWEHLVYKLYMYTLLKLGLMLSTWARDKL